MDMSDQKPTSDISEVRNFNYNIRDISSNMAVADRKESRRSSWQQNCKMKTDLPQTSSDITGGTPAADVGILPSHNPHR